MTKSKPKEDDSFIHPSSNFFLHSGVTGGICCWSLSQLSWVKADYTLDKSPVHCRTYKHTAIYTRTYRQLSRSQFASRAVACLWTVGGSQRRDAHAGSTHTSRIKGPQGTDSNLQPFGLATAQNHCMSKLPKRKDKLAL